MSSAPPLHRRGLRAGLADTAGHVAAGEPDEVRRVHQLAVCVGAVVARVVLVGEHLRVHVRAGPAGFVVRQAGRDLADDATPAVDGLAGAHRRVDVPVGDAADALAVALVDADGHVGRAVGAAGAARADLVHLRGDVRRAVVRGDVDLDVLATDAGATDVERPVTVVRGVGQEVVHGRRRGRTVVIVARHRRPAPDPLARVAGGRRGAALRLVGRRLVGRVGGVEVPVGDPAVLADGGAVVDDHVVPAAVLVGADGFAPGAALQVHGVAVLHVAVGNPADVRHRRSVAQVDSVVGVRVGVDDRVNGAGQGRVSSATTPMPVVMTATAPVMSAFLIQERTEPPQSMLCPQVLIPHGCKIDFNILVNTMLRGYARIYKKSPPKRGANNF